LKEKELKLYTAELSTLNGPCNTEKHDTTQLQNIGPVMYSIGYELGIRAVLVGNEATAMAD
jgi:hypothetical protein